MGKAGTNTYKFTAFGSNWYHYIISTLGYIVEFNITMEFYILLWYTWMIHSTCEQYLYSLIDIQSYDCTQE